MDCFNYEIFYVCLMVNPKQTFLVESQTNTKKGNRAYQHGKPPTTNTEITRGEKRNSGDIKESESN